MFQPRREVLKAKEGSIGDVPLPLLLHALLVEERTCTLELKLRNLEKHIHVEDGVPVGCDSNLLHETLGKYLVAKNKLSEADYQTVLAEAANSSKPFGSVLVEQKRITVFELFKHLQANLAHKILDVFRWHDARWRILPPDDEPTPIRLNTLQLVFTGCGQLRDETLARHFTPSDDRRFALRPDGPAPQSELKLSAKETRLVQLLKQRPTLRELRALPGVEGEALLRKLYALCVLEMVDTLEAVEALPAKSAPTVEAKAPPPPPAPAVLKGVPFSDDDEAVRQQLAGEFLSHRTKDPFDLLGVPVDVQHGALLKVFLAKADALAPLRFASTELKHKAETLLLAHARAYAALAEPESNKLHRSRRDAAEQAKKQVVRPSTTSQFKIRTDLLDANTQFEEGRKRLKAGQFQSAAEHFEYACDIEPRGRFRAHLAWARYQLTPSAALKSLAELVEACEAEPDCEEAWAFRGDVCLAINRYPEAEAAYAAAAKLNPKQRRYTEAQSNAGRAAKARAKPSSS